MKKVLYVTSFARDVTALVYGTREHWHVYSSKDNHSTLHLLSNVSFDCIFVDIGMTGLYVPDLLATISSWYSKIPFFILTREKSFSIMHASHKLGACGYFHLPQKIVSLVGKIEHFLSYHTQSFNSVSTSVPVPMPFVGSSTLMHNLRQSIHELQESSESILITGETGTGKELVAKTIHAYSPCSAGPYTVLNVSCITNTLADSVFFGTVKGGFTDAVESIGIFEQADQGTLFLDEIGELDLTLQAKLLRVLDDGIVVRVGSKTKREVSFRLVCATNRDLIQSVSNHLFREDLLHRIDVLRIEVPPLREHLEDISELAAFHLKKYNKYLSCSSLEKLHDYRWPGNVRQLFNCLSRAAAYSKNGMITPESLRF
jgi:two-component system, NtrC family, response regulator AtoC